MSVKEKRNKKKEDIVLKTMESLEIESKKDIRMKPYGKCITENDTSLSLFPSLRIKFSTTERSISDSLDSVSPDSFQKQRAICVEFLN
jgi:hypothetical protein